MCYQLVLLGFWSCFLLYYIVSFSHSLDNWNLKHKSEWKWTSMYACIHRLTYASRTFQGRIAIKKLHVGAILHVCRFHLPKRPIPLISWTTLYKSNAMYNVWYAYWGHDSVRNIIVWSLKTEARDVSLWGSNYTPCSEIISDHHFCEALIVSRVRGIDGGAWKFSYSLK
jgi:hypothetical protein